MLRKCLFPAAGYGTRFLPATKAMPKAMLPVVDKPLIQYGVEEAMHAGMTQIGLITGRTTRAVADHFDISFELENMIAGSSKEYLLDSIREVMRTCQINYTRQMEMKGLGHAVLVGQSLVGDEPFGVHLADDLCVSEGPGVLSQMVELFNEHQCTIVAIEEVPKDEIQNYGVIDGDEIAEGLYRVNNMVEKPAAEDAPSNLAIIGRYILTPDIFTILQSTGVGRGGEIQITDAIMEQASAGQVLAYKFKGRRFDCGSVHGFVEATNYIYERMDRND